MICPLTSRYWDLDRLVLENYKRVNYVLRENLQRHTQKLFTSLSCVLLSLVLFFVIAFQISDLTFNDYIT